jgi:hypothetical protein
MFENSQREEKIECVQKIFQLKAQKLEEESKLKDAPPAETKVSDGGSHHLTDSSRPEQRLVSKQAVVQAARWYRPIHHAGPCSSTKNGGIATVFDNLSKAVRTHLKFSTPSLATLYHIFVFLFSLMDERGGFGHVH